MSPLVQALAMASPRKAPIAAEEAEHEARLVAAARQRRA